MKHVDKAKQSYAIAAATHLRPDMRPPFARWRFGVRFGIRLAGYLAAIQVLLFVISHTWSSEAYWSTLHLIADNFLIFPLLLGVYGLLLPFMRSIRGAALLGAGIGAVLGLIACAVWDGSAALRTPLALIMMAFIGFFVLLLTLGMREVMLVRWRPPE